MSIKVHRIQKNTLNNLETHRGGLLSYTSLIWLLGESTQTDLFSHPGQNAKFVSLFYKYLEKGGEATREVKECKQEINIFKFLQKIKVWL